MSPAVCCKPTISYGERLYLFIVEVVRHGYRIPDDIDDELLPADRAAVQELRLRQSLDHPIRLEALRNLLA